uniref:Peptidase S1 domain-containing protein n=1 Tax=Malurus cyaneus samueli TaxID=2593467 RepID=A0A8C5TI54_9PASS
LLLSSLFLAQFRLCLKPEMIIGGREVKPHSRPYMAYVRIETGLKSHSCGGFLIRPDAVLTAAHCLDKEGITNLKVILGAHNISGQERSQQKFLVKHRIIHPKYSPDDFRNDIALLQLKPKAKINKYVKTIPWAGRNERVRAGAACEVSGWGRTSITGRRSDVMMEVKLMVQREAECQRQFRGYQQQSMICVGDDDGRKGSYRGDSGGPLVCNKKAHGIVSHGCERYICPAVFTRISYFEHWIREQLRRFALQELPGSPSSG